MHIHAGYAFAQSNAMSLSHARFWSHDKIDDLQSMVAKYLLRIARHQSCHGTYKSCDSDIAFDHACKCIMYTCACRRSLRTLQLAYCDIATLILMYNYFYLQFIPDDRELRYWQNNMELLKPLQAEVQLAIRDSQ